MKNNYFLHQSARDGFRSYLQSYASYSLKKIFDVNALDLAKVGKAFGFSVPPRVNVNLGTGKSVTTSSKSGRKRPRDDEEDVEVDEVLEEMEVGGGADEEEEGRNDKPARGQGKQRRVEVHGQKQVDKEVYRKEKDRRKITSGGGQWSR